MSKTERVLQHSISEQAALSQRRSTDRLRQQDPRPSSPSSSSSSAPPTPTKVPPTSGEKKIRVTTSDGRQAMLTLQPHTTYGELQNSIVQVFNLSPGQLCIRHGFPPRELPPPRPEDQNQPVALQHGDRISVEALKESSPDTHMTQTHSHTPQTHAHTDPQLSRTSSRELQDNIDLEMSSLCLLAALMGKTQPPVIDLLYEKTLE